MFSPGLNLGLVLLCFLCSYLGLTTGGPALRTHGVKLLCRREEKLTWSLWTVLKVAICPITLLAGSTLPVTDNLATDTSQLLITALILCNGSELTALQSTNYQQHFPKDMNNSPCETEAQGTTPSSYMRLIHNMNSSKGLLYRCACSQGPLTEKRQQPKHNGEAAKSNTRFLLFGWVCFTAVKVTIHRAK